MLCGSLGDKLSRQKDRSPRGSKPSLSRWIRGIERLGSTGTQEGRSDLGEPWA